LAAKIETAATDEDAWTILARNCDNIAPLGEDLKYRYSNWYIETIIP